MIYSALWMDHHHATLLTFSKEKGDLDKMVVSEEIITADKPVEHNNRHPNDVNHDIKDQHLVRFFHKIIEKLENVQLLMIMGPGISKSKFKHHCETHHHSNINKSIIGLETMSSHPSRSEMIKKAQSFFASFNF